jgi:hypothetical protein
MRLRLASLRFSVSASLLGMVGMLGLFAVAGSGCDLADPPVGTPVYLRIDTILLDGDPLSQGFLSHNFEDAWVFIDDQSVGAFELPVVMPALVQPNSVITVTAGIRQNGFSNSRINYPLMQVWDTSPAFAEGDTITLTPEVRYAADVAFHRVIDFEVSTPFDDVNGSVPMQVTSEDSLVFEGNRSAYIELNALTDIVELRSERIPGAAFPLSTDTIPEDDSPVFLEMDYRCNQIFDIWLRSIPPIGSTAAPINEYMLTLSPQSDWNKIYIGLTEDLGSLGLNSSYQIVIRGEKSFLVEQGRIFLDNLKIVSR